MATKTQIRLKQLTGSLDDTAAPLHPSAITDKSLQGVLDHVASGIKRITGGAQFSTQLAGHFNQNLHVTGSLLDYNQAAEIRTDAGVLTLNGATGLALQEGGADVLAIDNSKNVTVSNAVAIDIDGSGAVSIDSTAGSITMGAVLADGQTLKLGKASAAEISIEPHATPANEKISVINTSGTADDAIKIDAEAGGLTLAAGNDSLILDADGTDADALKLDSAGGIDVDAANGIDLAAADGDVAVTADGSDNKVTIKGDQESGVAIHLDGNAAAASVVDIDAGILDVDATGAASIAAGGSVEVVGGAVSKMVATSGDLIVSSSAGKLILSGASGDDSVHVTSDMKIEGTFTIAGSLTVPGDLTVQGTTTTLDTANLVVQDRIIALGVGAQALNTNSGLLFSSGSATLTRPDVAFGRVDTNAFGIGSIANPNSGSITSVATMTNDIAFRADSFQIVNANNKIELDTDVKVVSAADIVLDPGGANVLPGGDSQDSLGASGTAWANLFVDAIDLNGQGDISMGGTGRIDLDANDDTSIRASADNVITFETNNVDRLNLNDTALEPNADDGLALGSANKNFSDLFLADQAVLNFGDDQDVNLTHVHDLGLQLNDDRRLQFRDAGLMISSPSDGTLEFLADVVAKISGTVVDVKGENGIQLSTTSAGLNTHLSGTSRIGVQDNSATALFFQAGSDAAMLTLDTRTGAELVKVDVKLDLNADLDMQGSRDIVLSDSAAAALEIKDASGNGYLTVNTAQNAVGVGDNIGLSAGNAGDFQILHNGSLTSINNNTGDLVIEQKGTGGHLILSGASGNAEIRFGDAFSGGGGMDTGMINLASSVGEYTNFISNFSNSTSIVGALNSLASGGTRTKIKYAVTGSHAANSPLFIDAALNHDLGVSFAATDVYVNGQLLTSGTSIADGDYKLGTVSNDHVQFFFQLESGDQVQVIKA
ncbi:MAG: hypothetical protein VYE05_04870 [Bacteroidota bacterium]|nr:hypothetical protein [Bacteroidota bacterium]